MIKGNQIIKISLTLLEDCSYLHTENNNNK
jgi:hypothetical protein